MREIQNPDTLLYSYFALQDLEKSLADIPDTSRYRRELFIDITTRLDALIEKLSDMKTYPDQYTEDRVVPLSDPIEFGNYDHAPVTVTGGQGRFIGQRVLFIDRAGAFLKDPAGDPHIFREATDFEHGVARVMDELGYWKLLRPDGSFVATPDGEPIMSVGAEPMVDPTSQSALVRLPRTRDRSAEGLPPLRYHVWRHVNADGIFSVDPSQSDIEFFEPVCMSQGVAAVRMPKEGDSMGLGLLDMATGQYIINPETGQPWRCYRSYKGGRPYMLADPKFGEDGVASIMGKGADGQIRSYVIDRAGAIQPSNNLDSNRFPVTSPHENARY
jgi:hypothetical protein